jgi:hypothetical protein
MNDQIRALYLRARWERTGARVPWLDRAAREGFDVERARW